MHTTLTLILTSPKGCFHASVTEELVTSITVRFIGLEGILMSSSGMERNWLSLDLPASFEAYTKKMAPDIVCELRSVV